MDARHYRFSVGGFECLAISDGALVSEPPEAPGPILFANAPPAEVDWEAMLATLRKRGKLVLVGFPDVAFNSTNLVARELTVTGSFLGDRVTMREMLAFAQDRGIAPEVELMPMAQVNEAIQRLRENKARYRIVLFNETPRRSPSRVAS